MWSYNENEMTHELANVRPGSKLRLLQPVRNVCFRPMWILGNEPAEVTQGALAATLERIWKDLLGDGAMGTGDIRAELSRTMELIPGERDEPWVREQPYGEDAASAVAYTLRALDSGAPQEAAWSARRAYEAVDHHVMHRLGIADDERVFVTRSYKLSLRVSSETSVSCAPPRRS